VQLAVVAKALQIALHKAAKRARIGRCAHDGDRPRPQDQVHGRPRIKGARPAGQGFAHAHTFQKIQIDTPGPPWSLASLERILAYKQAVFNTPETVVFNT
jgi:hypothetical protein